MKLAELLRKARELKGVSLRAAGMAVNVNYTTIKNIEKGRIVRPKQEILNKLADYYGLNRDTVMEAAERIPEDVYWKLVRNPQLMVAIREYDVTNMLGE